MAYLTDRPVPDWLVPELARVIEECDAIFGVDSAPYSAQSITELAAPDVAFQTLLYIGMPAPDALDTVLRATDALGLDRGIAFDLILMESEPWSWPGLE